MPGGGLSGEPGAGPPLRPARLTWTAVRCTAATSNPCAAHYPLHLERGAMAAPSAYPDG
jgi:hypothetical protein